MKLIFTITIMAALLASCAVVPAGYRDGRDGRGVYGQDHRYGRDDQDRRDRERDRDDGTGRRDGERRDRGYQ
jgi:hypothetical protein